MDSFETTVVVNEDTIKELKKILIPHRFIYYAVTLGVSIGILLNTTTNSTDSIYVKIFGLLFGAGVFTVAYFYWINKSVKNIFDRMRESTHTNECHITTSFIESGIEAKNQETGSLITLNYNDIRRFAETKNLYIFTTKANQFTIVNRLAIDSANKRESFIDFLKKNCPNIRW